MIPQTREHIAGRKEGLARVKDGDFALILESATIKYEVSRDCNLAQVGGLIKTVYYAIGMRKGRI